MEKHRKKPIIICILGILLVGCLCGVYVNDYYHADQHAIFTYLKTVEEDIAIKDVDPSGFAIMPEESTKGLIFYPGGKVECEAYIPLMEECATKGILCVLVEMPFHLAVLDPNRADGIAEQFPEIEEWYIGGHSLGGAMAASYVADNAEAFQGLILLGAYATTDLSEKGLNVLSIYGSEDRVMNYEKYEKYRINLPEDVTETIIEGGCHAYFGMYGQQEGDGVATISNLEQIKKTADIIEEFIYGE